MKILSFVVALILSTLLDARVPYFVEQGDSTVGYSILNPVDSMDYEFGIPKELIPPTLRKIEIDRAGTNRTFYLLVHSSKYDLCLAGKNSACATVPMPHLPWVELFQVSVNNKKRLALRFHPIPEHVSDTVAAAAISTRFEEAVNIARVNLLGIKHSGHDRKSLAEEEEEAPIVLEPIEIVGSSGNDSGDGASFYFEIQNIFSAVPPADALAATPEKVACKAACDKAYDKASDVCRAVKNSRLRALCWGSAAGSYGACLAGC